MVWERFTLTGRNIKPKATIRKGGQIGLNNAVINKYKLDKFKYVVLFIDKEQKKIGIKPTNDEQEEGVRKLRLSKYGASIPAKNFIELYRLEQIKKRKLNCIWDRKDNMLVAEFSE